MNETCLRCNHPFDAHHPTAKRMCKRQTLTGWSEADKVFTTRKTCSCAGFIGPVPDSPPLMPKSVCPHECLEGSRICVICKKPVPAKVKH